MIDGEIEIAKLLNEYFVSVVKTLGNQSVLYTGKNVSYVKMAVAKYKSYRSINIVIERMEKLGNLVLSVLISLG